MAKETTKALRERIRSLKGQLAAARQRGHEKQAELIAGALEADRAKLASLSGRSAKRQ